MKISIRLKECNFVFCGELRCLLCYGALLGIADSADMLLSFGTSTNNKFSRHFCFYINYWLFCLEIEPKLMNNWTGVCVTKLIYSVNGNAFVSPLITGWMNGFAANSLTILNVNTKLFATRFSGFPISFGIIRHWKRADFVNHYGFEK